MKTVFSNSMVAHVWAQRSQSEGRSNNGNFWFEGDTIFSYNTPIGRFLDVEGHGTVLLISSISYSATTAGKHLNKLYRAASASHVFEVPTIAEGNRGRGYSLNHSENLAALVERYNAEGARMLRSRVPAREWSLENFPKLYKSALEYARVFDLPINPPLKTPKQWLNEIAAAHEARNTPEAKAKAAKAAKAAKEKKERKEALQRAEFSEQIKAWQRGELSLSECKRPYGLDGTAPCYLRVRGENLETSMGATVPLAHAVKAFRFVKACKEKGREWHRNGHTIRVGHFSVDSVDKDGNMRAGCHAILWEQIEEAAKQAGVWGEAASDAALEPSLERRAG